MAENNVITTALNLLDKYAEMFRISYNEENRYYEITKKLKQYSTDSIVSFDENKRRELIDFILSLSVPNIQRNLYDILGYEWNIDGENDFADINSLNDGQLLYYFSLIMSTITFVQNENLLLMKYGIIVWTTGFHKMAKLCRGKVIDMNTREIVSYPFDKFFNLNEVPETDESIIKEYINDADYIFATEKIDGSLVAITKLNNGKFLITTNGSFDNEQTDMAKKLIDEKYSEFKKVSKNGFTYIFEIIYPENKIVIDYGNKKAMYLLAVRNLKTFNLVSPEETRKFAADCKFEMPAVYDFENLDTMVNLAHTMKNANREGWVIRIGNKNGEFMVKLKLDEYFEMHKAFGKITVPWVYRHLLIGDIDDFIAICHDDQKKEIRQVIDTIGRVREQIEEKTVKEANEWLEKYHITKEQFAENRETMIEIINKVLSSGSNVKSFVIQYLKGKSYIENSIAKIPLKNMKMFFEEFL